jgi:hypothetical protein
LIGNKSRKINGKSAFDLLEGPQSQKFGK